METEIVESNFTNLGEMDKCIIRARRTAFVARFIVLREGKRTRAHRVIEMMEWEDLTTVEELATRFRNCFVENGDNMMPVDRDLRRALSHSLRSIKFFISEYSVRSSRSFIEALEDYARSNELLFGVDEQPKPGGWRLPQELKKLKTTESPVGKKVRKKASPKAAPREGVAVDGA
jgi:hypothetical protein